MGPHRPNADSQNPAARGIKMNKGSASRRNRDGLRVVRSAPTKKRGGNMPPLSSSQACSPVWKCGHSSLDLVRESDLEVPDIVPELRHSSETVREKVAAPTEKATMKIAAARTVTDDAS